MEDEPHKFIDLTARNGIAKRALFSLSNPSPSEELPETSDAETADDTHREDSAPKITRPGGTPLDQVGPEDRLRLSTQAREIINEWRQGPDNPGSSGDREPRTPMPFGGLGGVALQTPPSDVEK